MEKYSYLLLSLCLFLPIVFLTWKRPGLRKPLAPILLLAAFYGPISELLYFRDYWQPPTLAGTGKISPEDVFFSIGLFGLSAVLHSRFQAAKKPSAGHFKLANYGIFTIISALSLGLIGLSVNYMHLNSIVASSLIYLSLWGLILTVRPTAWRPSIVSALTITVSIAVIYGVGLNFLAPHYLEHHWLLYHRPLGATVLGNVPVTELVWFGSISGCLAASYGLAFGTAFANPITALRRRFAATPVFEPAAKPEL